MCKLGEKRYAYINNYLYFIKYVLTYNIIQSEVYTAIQVLTILWSCLSTSKVIIGEIIKDV
jgi:hypothetical protein